MRLLKERLSGINPSWVLPCLCTKAMDFGHLTPSTSFVVLKISIFRQNEYRTKITDNHGRYTHTPTPTFTNTKYSANWVV